MDVNSEALINYFINSFPECSSTHCNTVNMQSLSRGTHQHNIIDNHDRWDHMRQMISGFHSFILHLALLSLLPIALLLPCSASSFHSTASPSPPHSFPSAYLTQKPALSQKDSQRYTIQPKHWRICTLGDKKVLYPSRHWTVIYKQLLPCSCWWGVWWNYPNK